MREQRDNRTGPANLSPVVLQGLWQPSQLQRLHYGPGSVEDYLLACLPTPTSKVYIVTGTSLAEKTSLVNQVQTLLGTRHFGTFSKIQQHAPVTDLDQVVTSVLQDDAVDTIISIGGGSPIDSTKVIIFRAQALSGRRLRHIAIPTTLSAAECTCFAGVTTEYGEKTGIMAPEISPQVILYDSRFAVETPPWLWMSTGIRALDHAVELMCHPAANEMPTKWQAMHASRELFKWLPRYKEDSNDNSIITKLQLAAFASAGFIGNSVRGPLGLSHSLGYALGAPYGIPHGITSCMTLGRVVKLKAQEHTDAVHQLARMAPSFDVAVSHNAQNDCRAIGDRILELVRTLELETTLTREGVDRAEVHKITMLAMGDEDLLVYHDIRVLVESLW